MPDQPRLRASDVERDRVIAVLAEAHAAGRLGLDEIDERQSAVLAARFRDELWPIVSDLPEARDLDARATGSSVAPVATNRAVVAARPQRRDVAVLSGSQILVEPGTEEVASLQWWGGHDYDLTELMGPGVTLTFKVAAVMAGSKIWVPPGVRVIDHTLNIMAGNAIAADAQGDGSQGTVVLRGFSFWAGHEVKRRERRPQDTTLP